ncbi:uncharacterized protein TRIADDRAFT_53568 [Trichoplax adhaerens]|uniref:Rab-GAP TBC domain-containing protein n=1 Tax=Trichoplax adhaerens TaxID=10228 RepID=B3RPK0_TRIAD|nr:hypothetical protein TRIADDRAFT_53568 [Trichoplax adhaerens]EDV27648.1 hypothetical protein TRIADDRAFT_53568 [Trichoplax adhaerens]|eukprot:XP_002109482.1 hypothetical protein TRIADDRAFT_53568 [Trichoplax adhaerens]
MGQQQLQPVVVIPIMKAQIKELGMHGSLSRCRFRGVCWRVFLDCLPRDTSKWITATTKLRKSYDEIKEKYLLDPHQQHGKDINIDNPLSQDKDSVWCQFFEHTELMQIIEQDVNRTFPELTFFQSARVKNIMMNILFCYSRDNSALSYRQGMHELLAPIILTLERDIIHTKSKAENLSDIAQHLLQEKYLEHDSFHLFAQLMTVAEWWYLQPERDEMRERTKDKSRPVENLLDVRLFKYDQHGSDLDTPSSHLAKKVNYIQNVLLKRIDYELCSHLARLDIAPQIYGIRWIRVMFGREFPMDDVLVLWDAIFADGKPFSLVDYVYVAMLTYIRNWLLESDYATCMTKLMKYPPAGDISYFIDKALYVRDPSNNMKPPQYEYGATVKISKKEVQSNTSNAKTERKFLASYHAKTRNTSDSKNKEVTTKQKETSLSVVMKSHNTKPINIKSTRDRLSKGEDDVFLSHSDIESDLCIISHPTNTKTEQTPRVSKPRSISFSRKRSGSERKRSTSTSDPIDLNLKTKFEDLKIMCKYCSSKMDSYIESLQQEMQLLSMGDREDKILLAVAGLKKVRDILKGTLPFAGSPIEPDDVIDTDILVPAARVASRTPSPSEEFESSIDVDAEKEDLKELVDSSSTATDDINSHN